MLVQESTASTPAPKASCTSSRSSTVSPAWWKPTPCGTAACNAGSRLCQRISSRSYYVSMSMYTCICVYIHACNAGSTPA